MDQKMIGEFIARRRKELNMTQKELAEELGVTDRAVSKWENGRCMPDLSLIQPLSRILGVGVNDLLCGEIIEEKQYRSKSEENLISMAELNHQLNYMKSFRYGFWGFYVLAIFLLVYCIAKNLDSSGILALVLAYSTFTFYSRCRTMKRDFLSVLITVFGAGGTFMSLVAFIGRTW